MIKSIVNLLRFIDWRIDDEDIKIAKGKYKAYEGWKEFKQILKQQ